MKVPIATYAAVSRRLDTIGICVFLGTVVVGFLILGLVGIPIAEAVRDFFGGNIGQVLAIAITIPFLCLPLCLPLVAIKILDRRIGIRCPSCNESLTLGSSTEKVLITRKCSKCHCVVLTDEAYSLAPEAYRPWVIVPLLIVLSLLIIWFVAAEVNSPSSLFKQPSFWREEAIFMLAFFAIVHVYGMVMTRRKRRWETEAAADEFKCQSD